MSGTEIDGYSAWLLWSSAEATARTLSDVLAERREMSVALDSLIVFARTHAGRKPTHAEVETWAHKTP